MSEGPFLRPSAISALDYDAIAAVSELHRLCFDKSWTYDDFHHFLSDERMFLFVHGVITLPDGLILGRVAADEAEVLTLCVRNACRRQGVAVRLLQSGIEKAAEMGATHLFLEVSEENEAARNLYQAVGFEQVARRRDYYGNGLNALILKRNI